MTRRTRTLQLLLLPVLAGVLVAALLSAAWLAIGSPTPAQGATWFQVTRTGEAHLTGGPDQPFFLLALGNDGSAERGGGPGLGDAIHVIGVNPALGQATIIDIPRDTEGPGGGKINAYNSTQGLRAQANAIGQLVGVPIPFAITANFDGFTAMVDEIGGIDIDVPFSMHDSDAGSNFEPGRQKFNGDQALAFSRDRKTFPVGDIQRTHNQGYLILAALATLRAKNPTAADTIKLVATLGRHVELDGVSIRDLLHLGRLALSLDPTRIRNEVISVANSGNGTNLAVTADGRSLMADFADDGVLQNH
jgi:LCP family protein required for cell wall assembly